MVLAFTALAFTTWTSYYPAAPSHTVNRKFLQQGNQKFPLETPHLATTFGMFPSPGFVASVSSNRYALIRPLYDPKDPTLIILISSHGIFICMPGKLIFPSFVIPSLHPPCYPCSKLESSPRAVRLECFSLLISFLSRWSTHFILDTCTLV